MSTEVTEMTNKFPALKNDRFLKACRGEEVDRVPVWIMRQAGRYLPEFQEFRKKHDFFTICKTPNLACEVTLMPIKRYPLDAAIIFSDILVVPQALGMEVKMVPTVGPVIENPITSVNDINNLKTNDVINRLKYVAEAITLTRKQLDGKVPLIGFSGAPWTLMGYMIEGGGSKTMMKAKKWLYQHPNESHRLLKLLTEVVIDYLVMQVEAGAQVLQIFESSGEFLNVSLFKKFLFPYLQQISTTVKSRVKSLRLPNTNINTNTNDEHEYIPMILFVKGGHYSLDIQGQLGYDVVGIDWTVEPEIARQALGPNVTLQGNMDPCALYSDETTIRQITTEMLKKFTKRKYIANLGHGIYPDVSPTSVTHFLNAIQNL